MSKIMIFEKNPFTTAVSMPKSFHLTPMSPTFEIHQPTLMRQVISVNGRVSYCLKVVMLDGSLWWWLCWVVLVVMSVIFCFTTSSWTKVFTFSFQFWLMKNIKKYQDVISYLKIHNKISDILFISFKNLRYSSFIGLDARNA